MRIALVAGEASGDRLGAELIEAIAARVPDLASEGVAGPAMRDAGCAAIADCERLAVMGLVEPLTRLPDLLRLRRSLVHRWRSAPPDVFVGIDAPDFNLGLERRLRRAGIPTVHYVSPSVWAWRRRRIRTIARATDKVLCLLPFERAFYDRHGVAAEFVGHPLADRVPAMPDRDAARAELGLEGAPVVAVLPGSRLSEVARLGAPFIEACRRLATRYADIAFVTPFASPATRKCFAAQLAAAGVERRFTLLDGGAHTALIAADVALLASGTAALEAALCRRAMVAAYRLAPPTYALARLLRLVQLEHFTLPNLLTAEPLVPEFLQGAATPSALAAAVASLLDDPARRQRIEQAFAALYRDMARDASARAAAAVLALAGARRGVET